MKIPLRAIDKEEIALMEVYVKRESSRGVTSMNPRGGSSSNAGSECRVNVYVWLKP